jgi:hypothetical protein
MRAMLRDDGVRGLAGALVADLASATFPGRIS